MPKNLLVADDSLTIQKVVGITFANEDFQVTAVDNGEDALARARELKPDIILADVAMPRKNGYEVCEAVKSDPGLRHIPVVLLGGAFEAFDEARARQARADGHVGKPFETQALINKVKELTGQGAAAVPVGAPAPAQAPRPAPAPAFGPSRGFPPPGARPPAPGQPLAGAPRPGGPMQPSPGSRSPAPSMAPGGPPRPSGPFATGARPPGPAMPQGMGQRPPGAPVPPQGRPGSISPLHAQRGEGAGGGARPAWPGMPAPGSPSPGAPMPPAGFRPGPPQGHPAASPGRAVPAPQPARPGFPTPGQPTGPSKAPPASAWKDPFGFGLGAPAKPEPARAREDDFGDLGGDAAAPASVPAALDDLSVEVDDSDGFSPRASTELSGERASAGPELAPMHAFVPSPDAVGHKPEPSTARGSDGGEALLRDALSKASREVIERVVWEVVPQLAETIIRENLDRLVKQREG